MTRCSVLVSQLFNELFKNNGNRSEMAEKRHNQNYFMEMTTVDGVYDYLMYVGKSRHCLCTVLLTTGRCSVSYSVSCDAKTTAVKNQSDIYSEFKIDLFFFTIPH